MNGERLERQSGENKLAGNPVKPLRILEIGDLELFVLAVPEQTEFYWTGTKPRQWGKRVFGPIRVNYAYPILKQPYDVTQRFSFSAGGF